MKKMILTLALMAAFCAAASAQTQGEISEEKRRDIIRLLDMTKAADIGVQFLHQMTGELRNNFSMLPEEQREKIIKTFEEELGKEFTREKLIENYVPIYDKYLKAEEVKALITFYESPLGQKLVETLPSIMREATEDGTRRGREAGLRVMSRIASEGLLNPPSPKPAPKPAPKPKPRRGRS